MIKSGNFSKSDWKIIFPFFLLYILLTLLVSRNIFFWDTIQLGAKHATFFFDTDFSQAFLPDEFDSGHIPAFGMYLALSWKLFGKSLFVSHLAMLPFLLGIVYQVFILLKKFIPGKYLLPAMVIFLVDPTLLSQSILVSPDIPLVFFFLLALNAVLENKRWIVLIASIGLVLVSMRGMMVTFAIGVLDLIFGFQLSEFKRSLRNCIKKAFAYVPALVIIIGFNFVHYKYKGWMAYHDSSPWAGSFAMVDFKGMLYNVGILVWRLLDFGRLFLYIAGLIVFVWFYKRTLKDKSFKKLALIFIVVLSSLSVSFVFYKHLSGHRYLLPAFLSFSLLILYLVFNVLKSEKLRYVFSGILFIGLLSGNLWIYPTHIAQGWDASLAHTPYYNLRAKMLQYMEHENIPVEKVACTFPNDSELKYMDLSDSKQKHAKVDLKKNEYVLFSNVYNDFSDEQVQQLKSGDEFVLQKEFRKRKVFLQLYERVN